MGTACGAAAEGTNKCTESFSQNVAKKNTENRSTYSYERITLTRFVKEWELDLSCCGYGAKEGLQNTVVKLRVPKMRGI